MKWTPGVLALVTASVLVTLVAVGVGYAVTTDPEHAALVTSAERLHPTGASSSGATPPGPPQPYVEPGRAVVTLTARPKPSRTPEPKQARKPKRVKKPEQKPATAPPPPELDLTLSSFNVLGSSHTRSGGDGKAPGRVRARRAADIVRRHGSDVVGFQELQPDQLAVMRRQTNMDFWPGSALRREGTDNSLAWRRDRWVAVERHVVEIPYFGGVRRPMPYVKLRNLQTGLEAWFANFHNPASTGKHPNQQRFRTRATTIEIALANRLVRYGGDAPVFFTGDMNEHAEYFCRLTGGAPMIAARGGNHVGGCHPDNPRAVDWVFGSQGVTFTGYYEDRSALVHATTDHPVIVARAHIVGEAPAPSN